MSKPATPGHENAPTVILQGHMDMVCESNDKNFDFENNPITTIIDGEWLHADGTTLGADNGIGMAASLAVMADNSLEHGPIEALFTVDEETGMTGANNLGEKHDERLDTPQPRLRRMTVRYSSVAQEASTLPSHLSTSVRWPPPTAIGSTST